MKYLSKWLNSASNDMQWVDTAENKTTNQSINHILEKGFLWFHTAVTR